MSEHASAHIEGSQQESSQQDGVTKACCCDSGNRQTFSLVKFAEMFLAFVSGAVVAIGAAFIQDDLKRESEAQTWFETTFILESIDPIQNYTAMLDILLHEHSIPLDLGKEFPKAALVRMNSLTNDSVVTEFLIFVLQQIQISPAKRKIQISDDEMADDMRYISTQLNMLKIYLLGIDIDNKQEIFELAGTPYISQFLTNVRSRYEARRSAKKGS